MVMTYLHAYLYKTPLFLFCSSLTGACAGKRNRNEASLEEDRGKKMGGIGAKGN